jgi:hypothetical protein
MIKQMYLRRIRPKYKKKRLNQGRIKLKQGTEKINDLNIILRFLNDLNIIFKFFRRLKTGAANYALLVTTFRGKHANCVEVNVKNQVEKI